MQRGKRLLDNQSDVSEFRIVTQSGDIRWIRDHGLPLQDEEERRVIRIIGAARDITKRKRAEGRNREQLIFLEALLKAIPNPVFYKDIQGRYTGCNDAFMVFIGKTTEEIIGKTVYDTGPKEIADRYAEKDTELFQNPGIQRYEWKVKNAGGEIRDVIFNKAAIPDQSGSLVGLIGTILDITDRKRMERQIKSSLAEKEVLLREIHHRVKNNMLVIMSLIQIQLNLTDDVGVHGALMDLYNRVMAMSMVHEDLYRSDNLAEIDFSVYLNRLVGGIRQGFSKPFVDIHVSADDVSLDVDHAIPCGLITAELVTNAYKHAFPDASATPEGKLEIRVEMKQKDDRYTLGVCDNGIGLPPEIAPDLSKNLGLELVKSWARHQLRGTLTMQNNPGAEFLITFKDRKRQREYAVNPP